MSQSTTEVPVESIEEYMSEIKDEEDKNSSYGNESRAVFSMALSVIATSISLQMIPILDGIIVGVALWFVIAVIISNVFQIAGWRENKKSKNELDDIDILKLAYKRGLLSDEQFKDLIDNNLNK